MLATRYSTAYKYVFRLPRATYFRDFSKTLLCINSSIDSCQVENSYAASQATEANESSLINQSQRWCNYSTERSMFRCHFSRNILNYLLGTTHNIQLQS